jgi:ParB family transcriptional regulator, chromosome partitioning protein
VSPAQRRSLTIDDPIAGADLRHVARLSASSSRAVGRLREISVRSIHPNPNQPRKHFDEATLGALADSIRERGLLQPIVVRPTSPDAFELVAGERRWRAAQIAGDSTIPALIDDKVDEAGSLELALIENVVREDLTPIEEARTIVLLLDSLNIKATLLSRRLGRSRTDIAHTVRLLDLPDQAIELINAGVLTKGHGKALLTEPDHGRRRILARRAAEEGWSVRTLEAEIGRRAEPRRRPTPHPDHEAAASRLQDAINRATGSDVRARPHRSGYQLLLDQAAAARLAELLEAR